MTGTLSDSIKILDYQTLNELFVQKILIVSCASGFHSFKTQGKVCYATSINKWFDLHLKE
jgi:hypothetical protein